MPCFRIHHPRRPQRVQQAVRLRCASESTSPGYLFPRVLRSPLVAQSLLKDPRQSLQSEKQAQNAVRAAARVQRLE